MKLADFEARMLLMGFTERKNTEYRKRWDRQGKSIIIRHGYEFNLLYFGIWKRERIQGYAQMIKWLTNYDKSGAPPAPVCETK